MTIQIGIDEAGYGPNLGPLVVATSVWEVRCDPQGAGQEEADLYRLLKAAILRKFKAGRIAIADSKRLYKPGSGLRLLERAVHGALAALDGPAASWSLLVERLGADRTWCRRQLPWQARFDCRLPVDATAEEVFPLGRLLARVLQAAGCRLVALQARLVFPAELNDLICRHDSKGAALSHVTLGMLREIVNGHSDPVRPPADTRHYHIVCDKHGGRNRYQPLLAAYFPEASIEILTEGRAESRYVWGAPESGIDISFRSKGESFLPAALASMTAKYLRELAMRGLNEYWMAHLPDLKPTAGYPVDARRFRSEISAVQKRLDIPDHQLWRNR